MSELQIQDDTSSLIFAPNLRVKLTNFAETAKKISPHFFCGEMYRLFAGLQGLKFLVAFFYHAPVNELPDLF